MQTFVNVIIFNEYFYELTPIDPAAPVQVLRGFLISHVKKRTWAFA